MPLTVRQAKFVDQYLLCGSGSEAARRAGYSAKTARQMASENLTKPAVVEAIRLKQLGYEAKLQITKDDVVNSLLKAIDLARDCGDPRVMISGFVQVAKLCGFYQATHSEQSEFTYDQRLLEKYDAMTDEEIEAALSAL